MDYQKLSKLLKVISDENRLKIIDMLSCTEMTASDLLCYLNISQSTLSHHMKILVNEQIIKATKTGTNMNYSLNEEFSSFLKDDVYKLLTPKTECVCLNSKK